MTKFALVANAKRPTAEGGIFLATMTPKEFMEAGYCDHNGINIKQNTREDSTNKHPNKLFLAFTKDGEQYSGSVSKHITSMEDITKPMISIIEFPNAAGENKPREERIRPVLHNQSENAGAPTLGTLGLD